MTIAEALSTIIEATTYSIIIQNYAYEGECDEVVITDKPTAVQAVERYQQMEELTTWAKYYMKDESTKFDDETAGSITDTILAKYMNPENFKFSPCGDYLGGVWYRHKENDYVHVLVCANQDIWGGCCGPDPKKIGDVLEAWGELNRN